MADDATNLDVAVVGAGWAGIGVSQSLKAAGLSHCVYEKSRICETWRSQRWASFRMNTPNALTVLPGDSYGGDDPEGYMSCEDFIEMVAGYARRHRLPVREGVEVLCLRPHGEAFELESSAGRAIARSVVVATGNLNVPRRPEAASRLPPAVKQIDGSEYYDAAGLPPGAILVIGCGNSGGQIAEDLALAGRRVYLSTGRNGRVPRTHRGRDIFLWLTDTGRMAKPRSSGAGRGRIGATHTISLQSLSALGIVLLGRLEDVDPEGVLTFADSLDDSAAHGDRMSEEVRAEIDAYIERKGLQVPPAVPDEAETVARRFPEPPILRLDLAAAGITTVIWSTGFTGDFRWLQVPGAVAEDGRPNQSRCLSVPGVYFAGLDTQESLRAGTVLAVEEECERIVGHILANRGSPSGVKPS